jgi:hypothetical protein
LHGARGTDTIAVCLRQTTRRIHRNPWEQRRMPESDTVAALVLDLLEWIGPEPRPYPEVMEAWRTSCPRLQVWEEANARGFIAQGRSPDAGAVVFVSPAGIAHLTASGRAWRPAR